MQSSCQKTERKLSEGAFLSSGIKVLALFFLLFALAPHDFAQTNEQIDDTISIDTKLVDLNVSVFSRNPKLAVGDLQQKDFVVLENGEPEEISFFASASAPFDLVLLID